jgi:hypothetical protein
VNTIDDFLAILRDELGLQVSTLEAGTSEQIYAVAVAA